MNEDVELLEVDNNVKKDNKKGNKSSLIIIFIVVLIFCGVVAYLFLNTRENKEYTYTNYKYSEDVSLNANYQFNVIANIDNYLSVNHNLVSKLGNADSIEIDASKIVASDVFNKCSGKVIVTKLGDSYDYSFDTSCGENADDSIKGINGVVDNISKVEDGLMVVSYNDPIYEDEFIKGIGSLTITYYDSLGNIRWTDIYNNNSFVKGNVYLDIIDVRKIDKYYYFMGEMNSNVESGSAENQAYYLKYDLEGKLVDSKKISCSNTEIYSISGFVGKHNDAYYYGVLTDMDIDGIYLLSLNNDEFELFNIDKAKDIGVYFDGEVVVDDYIYGVYYDRRKEEYDEDKYPLGIFKMDFEGNIIKSDTFYYEKADIWTDMLKIKNNSIYVRGFIDGEEALESYTVIYDKDLSYVKNVDENRSYLTEDGSTMESELLGDSLDEDWFVSKIFSFDGYYVEVLESYDEDTILISHK